MAQMMAGESLSARLQAILAQVRPDLVLVIGDSLLAATQALAGCRGSITCLSSSGAAKELSGLEIHDLALVWADAALAETEIAILLSRLRDIYARKVLVIVPCDLSSGSWNRRSLVRLGFTPYGTAVDEAGEQLFLYQFDIATYKTTPDWLSSNNWANPELWDKYRW
ncbi:MAG: UDP-N-acetyl glucosamine 2-epimerase [Nitrococcus sp.]|nr:UDP-N-acetyl glucosamine 2-epimerase [Nitrococcus sp.]